MADGKLEIQGIEEVIKQVTELKTEMASLVESMSKGVKATAAYNEANLKNAKTLTEVNKAAAIEANLQNESNKVREKTIKVQIELTNQQVKEKQIRAENQKIQKLQVQLDNAEKGSREALAAQLALNTIRLNKLTEEQRKNTKAGQELEQETAQLKSRIVELDSAIGNHTGKVGNYENATKSIRQEIKELTMVIAQAKLAQNENTAEVIAAKQRLGELKDTMQDVSNEAKVLGSDTKHIDMLVGSVQAVGAAGQLAEAGMQAFGSENEDVAKGIQKLVIIQSAMNATQEIGNALQKESAFMMGLGTAATKAKTAAQAIYTAAVGTSTGALKAFKLALLGTGIGAIIVGIGLLIENWDKLTGSVDASTDALDNFKKASEKIKEAEQNNIDILKKKTQLQSEVTKAEIEASENRLDAIETEKNKLDELIYSENISNKQREEFSARKKELYKEEGEINQQIRLLEIDLENQLKEEKEKSEKEAEDNFKKEQERLRKDKEAKEKRLEEIKKENQEKAEAHRQYLDDMEKLDQESFERKQEIDAENYEITKEAIQEQYDQDINDANEQYALKLEAANGNELLIQEADAAHKEALYNAEVAHWTAMLLLATKGSEDYNKALNALSDLRLKKAQDTAAKELQSAKWLADAKQKIRENELSSIEGVAQIIQKLAKKDSALAKAAFIIEKAVAVARIWTSVWASNAIIEAEAAALAIPTAGASVAAGAALVTSNLINAGINTGLIAAQTVAEIAAFRTGTNDAPGGPAIVGENPSGIPGKGREMITLPDGTKFITPDKATFIPYLPEHSKVTPNHLLNEALAESVNMPDVVFKQDNEKMLKLLQAIHDKPSLNVSLDKSGIHVISKNGTKKTQWLNKRYRGNA